MNVTKVLILPAVLLPLPLLLGSNAPATRIKFAPAEGKSLTKTFEVKANLNLEDMTLGGAAGGMQPEMEMTMAVDYKVAVSDEYEKMGDGTPMVLKRTFDDLKSEVSTSMKMEIMGQKRDQDSNTNAESELTGKTVAFRWDAEKKEFKKAFEPAGPEEKLLEGLREDMDLRGLLPAGEVKEGEEWEIDPKALVDVLAPGGNLALKPKDAGDKEMSMGASGMENMAEMFGEDIEGKSKATFVGLREVDGAQYAVVKVNIDVKAKTDMTDKVREGLKKQDLPPEVGKMEFDHVDIEFALETEGELLWDVAGGHFHSLDLSGTTSFKSDQAMSMEVQGKSMKIEQSMEFSGTQSFSAKAK
jgi:hypothetical protein